jgi:hypothetical protein
MLAMDEFRDHLLDRIRNRLRSKNTDLVIIPSGMKSQLQPLDVSINKPFKHLVCKHYDACLNKDNHIMTPSSKIKRASASIKWSGHQKLGKKCLSVFFQNRF